MKNSFIYYFLVLLLIILLQISNVFGIPFSSSDFLESDKIDLGLADYLAVNKYWGTFLTSDFGITHRFNSVVKVGYVGEDQHNTYASIQGKILLSRMFGNSDNLTLIVGGHYSGYMGIDTDLLFGSKYKNLENYFGFDLIYNLSTPVTFPCSFIAGIKFNAFAKDDLLIEIGIPVTSDAHYMLGTSLKQNF